MSLPKLMQRGILAALFLGPGQALLCQVLIKGTVFDRSERFPLQAVSVMGSSGAGASTDSLGHYSIRLTFSDSIYFSYLGKSSAKSPVRDINPDKPFDVSMQETMDSLVPVSVQSKNYIRDSASIRAEYKKVFDYESDYLENMKSGAKGKGMGVGLDMDMILDNKANTRMLTLQQRLEKEEQDNYIDSRFTKAVVHKITGLDPPALDTFMHLYRPSYEFIKTFANDYEFYKYILNCGKSFSAIQASP